MSKKFDGFIIALRKLCIDHQVVLAVEMYDSIQIWDLKPGDDPIHVPELEDRTEERSK